MSSSRSSQLQSLHAIIETLPQGLEDHLFRTRDVAMELAQHFNVNAAKVELATLGHDICRALSPGQLLAEARKRKLSIHPVEERIPILLHGPLAVERLRRDCGVTDSEVLNAVHWHSTGCAGIGRVGLVVFLADKLDPHKRESRPHLRIVAEMAQGSLERAAIEYLTAELKWLLGRGELLHPASVECRNDLLMLSAL